MMADGRESKAGFRVCTKLAVRAGFRVDIMGLAGKAPAGTQD